MLKNNSGLIAKTKQKKYKKELCLTQNLVHKFPTILIRDR